MSITACLGNGFPLKKKKAFLIGGGIGIPPMLELAKNLDCEKTAVIGYRDQETFLAHVLFLTLLCSSMSLLWHTQPRQAPIPHAIFSSREM